MSGKPKRCGNRDGSCRQLRAEGSSLCASCLAVARAARKVGEARKKAERIPTFDDFERIANRKSPCGWGYE